MTKTNSVTKRMLAMVIAMLLVFSGVVVSSNATGETNDPNSTTTTSEVSVVKTTTQPTTVPTTVPASKVPTTVAPTTTPATTAPATTVPATTIPATTVPATTVPVTVAKPTSVPAPTVTKSDADKTITVKAPVVTGYEVYILFEPAATAIPSGGNQVYVNLTPGQKYTIKAYVVVDGAPLYSNAVTETIKDKHNAPSAPVPSKVTSTSITVTPVNDCQFQLTRVSDGKIIYPWGTVTVFEKLTANTAYLVSIRKKETDTKYASDAVSVTVKTLKAGDKEAVAAPVLVDKTNTTITVAEVKDVQFSINKGKTWQTSGEFKGLTPNTIYGIIARKIYDPAVQDPNPTSSILEIRTNSREKYTASTGKCKFTVAEGTIYANEEIKVTVTGDGPSDIYAAEYGDTRLIPDAVIIDGNAFDLTRSGEVYVGYIVPGANNANSELTLTVVYRVQKYDGEFWDPAGTVESHPEIKVGPVKTVFTTIGEFFVSAANLLLNTIPQFLADLFGSEMAGKFYDAIVGLLGKIGDLGSKA